MRSLVYALAGTIIGLFFSFLLFLFLAWIIDSNIPNTGLGSALEFLSIMMILIPVLFVGGVIGGAFCGLWLAHKRDAKDGIKPSLMTKPLSWPLVVLALMIVIGFFAVISWLYLFFL